MTYTLSMLAACFGIVLLIVVVYLKLRHWASSPQNFQIFQSLYDDVDGFYLSKKARKDYSEDSAFVYGEIDYHGFHALLSLVHPRPEDVFFDLGSGLGKALICAFLEYPMQAYHGIELFKPLHDCAEYKKKQLQQYKQSNISKIIFHNDDLFNANLSSSTIVFINATGFFAENLDRLIALLKTCPIGARIIISSKRLPVSHFKLLRQTMAPMSWGPATVYIYQRR